MSEADRLKLPFESDGLMEIDINDARTDAAIITGTHTFTLYEVDGATAVSDGAGSFAHDTGARWYGYMPYNADVEKGKIYRLLISLSGNGFVRKIWLDTEFVSYG